MKKILLVIGLFVSINLSAQTVNGFPIKDIELKYIRIVGSLSFKGKATVDIDFGQEQKFFTNKDTKIMDIDGKKKKFNSMIDALNYFSQFGYELDQAYAINVDKTFGKQTVYHYILSK